MKRAQTVKIAKSSKTAKSSELVEKKKSNSKSVFGYRLTPKQASMFCRTSNPLQLTLDHLIESVPRKDDKRIK